MRFTVNPPLPPDAVRDPILKYLTDDGSWYILPGALTASPKHRAASILVDLHALERNCLGPFTGGYSPSPEVYEVDARDAVITISGVAAALENLPEITVRQMSDQDANAFLLQECRRFLKLLQRLPVPESWQIEKSSSWPHMFRAWHALCERIALEAGYAKVIDGEIHYCGPEQSCLYGSPRTPALPKSHEDVRTDLCRQACKAGLAIVDPAKMPPLVRWFVMRFGRVE